jgi:hypothetical protein
VYRVVKVAYVFQGVLASIGGVQIDAKSLDGTLTLHEPQVNDPRTPNSLPTLPIIDPRERLEVPAVLCDDDEQPSWRATIALHCEKTTDLVKAR